MLSNSKLTIELIECAENFALDCSKSCQDPFSRIEEANRIILEIDQQVNEADKCVRQVYKKRYPELTVANSSQYFQLVKLLENNPQQIVDEEVKEKVSSIVDTRTHFLLCMTAATTQGSVLDDDELRRVLEDCDTALHLLSLRTKLLSFVELNMTKFAPNLSVLLGPSVAAKLVSRAGGLTQLAAEPACNISVIGSEKVTTLGVSTVDGAPVSGNRWGHIYHSDIVQRLPLHHIKDVRKRAVRLLAAKSALAARCDLNKSHADGNFGAELREQVNKRLDKELEPPPKKAPRPLPAPIDKASKKRGGKRVRRQKARYAETALRRQKNRIAFNKPTTGDEFKQ